MGAGSGRQLKVALKNRPANLRVHLFETYRFTSAMSQYGVTTGGSYIGDPVHPLAEHCYEVSLAFVVRHYHRERSDTAGTAAAYLKRLHAMRRQASRSGPPHHSVEEPRHPIRPAASVHPLLELMGDLPSLRPMKAPKGGAFSCAPGGSRRRLHAAGAIGTYDSAVIEKDEDGKVHVHKTEKPTQHGAWTGAGVGALVGILFPPAIIGSAIVGAGAGGLIGHLRGGVSRDDLKELGDELEAGSAAVIVLGESKIEEQLEKAVTRANKLIEKQIDADAEELQREIDAAAKEGAN